jgi:hypothetical protein
MSGYQVVQVANTVPVAVGGAGVAQAACPAGKSVVGGGYQITFGGAAGISADASYPAQGGWRASFRNNGTTNVTLTVNVYAICVFVAN